MLLDSRSWMKSNLISISMILFLTLVPNDPVGAQGIGGTSRDALKSTTSTTFSYLWGEDRVKLEVRENQFAVYLPQSEDPSVQLQQYLADLDIHLKVDAIEETPYQGLMLVQTPAGEASRILQLLDQLPDGWASPCLDYRGRLHIPRPEILVTLDSTDLTVIDRVLAIPDLQLIREFPSGSPLLQLSFAGTPRQVEERIQRLLDVSGVKSASPNFILHLPAMAVPNDTFFGAQWHLQNTGQAGNLGVDINAADAWGVQTGSLSVRVAIIDEGVDVFHEDLAANIVAGHDSTNQASPAGVPGNCASTDGHGTACAGLAAGIGNNSLGISGVAWTAEIQPVRLGFGAHWTENAWIIDALTWASDNGSDILSNSWGGGAPSTAEQNTLQYTLDTGRGGLGCILVFASGNDNGGVSYPAAYGQAIAVGASSPCDERKSPTSCDGENFWGSNFGTQQTVVAPGVLMVTTDITGAGGYVTTGTTPNYTANFNGTSSATPVTSGALAVLLAQDGTLTAAQVRTILETSSDDQVGPPAEDTPGFDNHFGFGRINLANMLALLGGPTGPSTLTCIEQPIGVQISWTNGDPYDEVRISRDGSLLATVAGNATGYLDLSVPIGQHAWEIQGVQGGTPSLSASCSVFLLGNIRDLVWAPETGTTDSGTALTNALVAAGRSVVTVGSIAAMPDLDRLDRIWVQLGMYPNNHALTTAESAILDTYLTNGIGGKAVFLEGGDTWFFDSQTPVHARFGITGLSDGASVDTLDQIDGINAVGCDLSGLSFSYTGEDTWVDRLAPAVGSEVVQSNLTPAYDIAVFRDSGGYITFGSSFEIGGLAEAASTRQQLVEAIINCLSGTIIAPADLVCSPSGSTVTLTWINAGGWDSIEVTLDGGTPQLLAGSSTGTTFTGLASGGHTVAVVAVVGGETSAQTSCNFGIDPTSPSGLNCVIQGTDAALSWTNGEIYQSVEVIRNGQVIAVLAGTATSHVETAPGGGVHLYLVQGVVGGFNSTPIGCGLSIDPQAITSFSCTPVSSQINMTWVNAEVYDSIDLLRNGVSIQALAGSATSSTDLPGRGSHSYTIRGTISGLNSANTTCAVAVAPTAPASLTCASTSGVVSLQWTNSEAYNQILVTRDGVQVALLGGTATSHSDSSGTGVFEYGVTGVFGGSSSSETICTATNLPEPITALSCSYGGGTVSLFWSEGVGIDAIEIRRDGVLVSTVPALTGFYQETGAPTGTRTYALRSISGGLSSSETSCDVIIPPGPITGLICVSNQPLTAQLDWTSPTGATSITITRDGVLLDTVTAATTSYLDSAAPAGIPIYALTATVSGVSGPLISCGVLVDSPTPPPIASFSASVASGIAPLEVQFTDASTGSIDSWAWNFGDGTTSIDPSPLHLFQSSGSFPVVLLVTGPGGSHSTSLLISVDEPAPIADFSATPTSGTVGMTVVFSDISGGGAASSWSWNFGDGSAISTQQNPSHTYTVAGSYAVSLTVTGAGGSDSLSRPGYITVAELAPVADFSATPTSGTVGMTVAFSDLSSGGPSSSWSWNFGDGSAISTQQNPSHT
ncbi:MAG: S8 family serine peptidase, partial [Planctomycetota bacterium]|nr:S8 family serine peptidase [Planctomycetota bacterium]